MAGGGRYLDKNHGFMKFIIKNQVDRQKFEEEERQRLSSLNVDELKYDLNNTDEEEGKDSGTDDGCRRISFKDFRRFPVDFNYLNQIPSKPENMKSLESRIFQLEFQTKTGDKIDIPVRSRDTAEQVANQVVSQYPLDTDMKDALIKRLDKAIKRYRRNGN